MTTTTEQRNGTQKPMTAMQKASKDLRTFLESPEVKKKLAEVANSFIKPEDLIRMALLTLSRQPELANCTQFSILRSLMDAAALGIKPGGLMGRGYLVPRRNNKQGGQLECQFDPGWRGLVDIARRSGSVVDIVAHEVRENDLFSYEFGDDEKIIHKPAKRDRGKVVGAYAIAIFQNGARHREVLDEEGLAKIKAVSPAADNGPWKSWEEEQARKSAVRRLCKYLPYSEALERAIEVATEADAANLDADVSVVPAAGVRDLDAELAGETAAVVDAATGEVIEEPKK